MQDIAMSVAMCSVVSYYRNPFAAVLFKKTFQLNGKSHNLAAFGFEYHAQRVAEI